MNMFFPSLRKSGKFKRRALVILFVALSCTTYDAGVSVACRGCDDVADIADEFESQYPSSQYRDLEVHARITVYKKAAGLWIPIPSNTLFEKICGWDWMRALKESGIDWAMFESVASMTYEGGGFTSGSGDASGGGNYQTELVAIYGTTCVGDYCETRVVAWVEV